MTLIVALTLFFISGAAGLIYQVAWQRILVIFSGADVYSTTLVVASFMAGLGCGSWVGGRVADRLGPAACLVLFFAAEAGIALFGIFSKTLLYDLLHDRWGHLSAHPVVMVSLLFGVLLWPTFLMGASLPLLARALIHRLDSAARTIGWLYGINTAGAAAGAFATTWLLLPARGIEGAVMIAALLNLISVVCAGVLVLLVKARTPAVEPAATGRDVATDPAPRTWLALSALAGFVALSLEIVWFRVLGVVLKSTSFTFGTLLAQYLLWLGVGSLIGGVLARRSRRPGLVFLVLQAASGLCGGLSVAVLVAVIDDSAPLAQYLAGYDPFHPGAAFASARDSLRAWVWPSPPASDLQWWFFRLYFLLPAVLIGPATLLSGISFPFLQKAAHTELLGLGRRVGSLLLANIAGSTVGTMVTGWVLLGLVGTAGTLRLLVVCSLVFALLAVGRAAAARRPLWMAYPGVTAVVAVLVVAMPGGTTFWARLHGSDAARVTIAEDGSGVSVLRAAHAQPGSPVQVVANGLGQSWIPYGGIHTVLGALPAFLHPHPRDVAIIGLGSGNTLFAMAGREEIERVTSIEIVKPQIETLRDLLRRQPYPGLLAALEDRRIEHVFGDGRRYLKHTLRRFDILEADALRPSSAYAGNLYSREYFELLRARLNPGGLAVTWAPTPRVEETFLSVFPFVVKYGQVLIGSTGPMHIDNAAVRRRLDAARVTAYYTQAGIDIRALLYPVIASGRISDRAGDTAADINTDLHPKDEFGIQAHR